MPAARHASRLVIVSGGVSLPRVPRPFIEGAGVAGGMMGRAELGGAIAEALATAVREMLSGHADRHT
jgi:hypothetical protein